MKIKVKWRILLCLAAPLLSFVFIRQEWLARLVAVSGISLVIAIGIFILGLNPKTRILGSGGYKRVHKHSERRDKITEFIGRFLIVLFGIGWLYLCIRPLVYDDIQFIRQGSVYAKHVEGRVTHNDTLYAAYFILQGLLVKEDGQQMGNSYTAFLFPRVAHLGKTYTFIIAPKTGLILDFEEISTTNNSD